MHEIIRKLEVAKGIIIRFDVRAPEIAKKAKPGQFVIVRITDSGERIPLTIADKNAFEGYITLIFQIVGKTTAMMRTLREGDAIKDLVGPLGKPADIKKLGTVIMIGGGTGIAILHHIAKGFKEAGNYVIGIIGAREKDLLILEHEMSLICDELIVTTDDGSYGVRGFVTGPLEKYLEERYDIKKVYAIGPIPMMKNVCKITEKYNIPTMVSLNPIMIDGTGMCGGCRVTIKGETKFCCVDGPDFNGQEVDFDELVKRNNRYLKDEKDALLYSIRRGE